MAAVLEFMISSGTESKLPSKRFEITFRDAVEFARAFLQASRLENFDCVPLLYHAVFFVSL
jgi:hypothetical protein